MDAKMKISDYKLHHRKPLYNSICGEAFKATHKNNNSVFVVQRIIPAWEGEGIEDTKRQIERVIQVPQEKNLIKFITSFEENKIFWLLSEYSDDQENLAPYSNRHNLELPHRMNIISDVTSGLAYLHGIDVLHNNLCPESVVIFKEKERHVAKVRDYGLSGLVVIAHGRALSSFAGFLRYMAPELFDKDVTEDEQIGPKSDVFSTGLICYQILSATEGILYDKISKGTIGKNIFSKDQETDETDELDFSNDPSTRKMQEYLKITLKKDMSKRPSMQVLKQGISECVQGLSIGEYSIPSLKN